jgi:hypothetical protein
MSVIIKGGVSNILADVDANNNLKVNLPTILSGSGYASMVGEVDDGTALGFKTIRPMDVSQDYRLRTGIDKILFQDTYNHTVINNAKYQVVTSTMTVTNAGGFLNLNAGNSVASGNVARVQSFKTFTSFNTYPIYFDIKAKFSFALQANNVIEFGLGFATTTTTPTDGVFFRAVGGQLNAVVNTNGNETQKSNVLIPNASQVYHFAINIGQDMCTFWVDDVIVAKIETPNSYGSPAQSNAIPILLRNYNSGAVTNAVQFNVAQLGVTLADMDSGKDWATTMVTNGQSSISAPDGQAVQANTSGTTTTFMGNSVAPTNATLSNTAAGYGPLYLGGQFQFAAVGGAETDYVLFAYLNPAGTAAIPGKTLVITGFKVDVVNTVTAVATQPTVFQWSLGVGGTAVSLATADSLTAGTRATRRLGMGIMSMVVGTPVGGMATPSINNQFASPLMVEAGTYCHVILKIPVGTATATEIFRGLITINGYFE